MSSLVPGTEVRARSLRWEVVRSQQLGEQTLYRLRGLDEWFNKQGCSSKDSEFDLIYANGDNNLENLKAPDDTWKVRLIEEDFHRLMFEAEGV